MGNFNSRALFGALILLASSASLAAPTCVNLLLQTENLGFADAVKACKQVKSTACIKFVHGDSISTANILESAKACKNVQSMKCVHSIEEADLGLTRAESAQACKDVLDFTCIKLMQDGDSNLSITAAAKICRNIEDTNCIELIMQNEPGIQNFQEAAEICRDVAKPVFEKK